VLPREFFVEFVRLFFKSAYRRYLLCEWLDAYLPLDEGQHRQLESPLLTEPGSEVRAMALSFFEKYDQKGREALPAERVKELLRAVLRCQSARDLGLA
jgi:hypothetical protein